MQSWLIRPTLLLVIGVIFVLPAEGSIKISVVPSSAPNVFGSPSWAGYATKARVRKTTCQRLVIGPPIQRRT